jgi:tRNA G10  N-methylase Trm11
MGQAASIAYAEQGMWDFRGADTKQFTHCFHIYPAMMIPQIARELILRYGVEGGLLFDPYCGTGTSLVESRLAGMNAIGTDINPTARMIAKSKILDYDLETLDQCIDSLLEDFRRKNASEGPLYGTELEYYGTEPEYVTWERLEDWFPKRSISEISYVIEKIGGIESAAASLFLRVALSECLRLVSYQRNGEFKLYRIPAEKRNEYYEPLLPKLLDRIERNRRGLDQYHSNIDKKTTVKICDFNTVQDDGSRYFPSKTSVDLVVTSPPYGDSGTTVAYAQFSWLSNVWLGLDDKAPGALDRELMGGRRNDVGKFGCPEMDHAIEAIADEDGKRASEVMNFYNEYLLSIQNVASQIKKGGHVCFVVGNRTVKGTQLPTDQFTAWAFEQEGLEHITTYIREIPNKRMPSKNSPSNKAGVKLSTMVNEYIVVCRKN